MTDAELCAAVVRKHAKTFTLAASLLTREKRRGVFALYAFCRTADDIVDRALPGDDGAVAALRAHRAELDATLAGAGASGVFRELAWTVDTFGIPRDPLVAVLDGIACDLCPVRYATWSELSEYCAAVASSVGEMCTYVFGLTDGGATLGPALSHARTLGVAMQLTNILRDIGEDARRGRCYLPDDDLATFGLTRDDVLRGWDLGGDPRWRSLMQFEIARARQLYADAEPGLAMLARDAQQCAMACARGYAEILGAIEQLAYNTFGERAVVPAWRKATVLWEALRVQGLGVRA